ncbi:unnamed protein product [Dicrocoelium dendriticum]|nr:unnamed protein product [Dicrocoelium dendriticum]CAH8596913.1 unnamed protein product [Dicrocoelium dendriticum]
MIEIFHLSEDKTFRCAILSRSLVFTSLCTLVLFVAPAAIVFSVPTESWSTLLMRWAKLYNCSVLESQSFILLVTNTFSRNTSSFDVWTPSSDLPSSISGSAETHLREKFNFYSLFDAGSTYATELAIAFRLKIRSTEVFGVHLQIPVHCILVPEEHNQLNVVGLISEHFIGDKPQTALNIFGTLRVNQKRALPAHYDRMEDYINGLPLFLPTSPGQPGSTNLEETLYNFARRNFTMRLHQRTKVPTFGSVSTTGLYRISLKISLPEQKLFYETPAVHQAKWFYIRYISIWIILVWPISKLLRYVFEGNLLQDTNVSLIKP